MKRPMMILAGTAAAFLFVQGDARAQSMSAQDFLNQAVPSNEFEVTSSELALQNSQSEDVGMFAEHMIHDHTEAGTKMEAAAAEQGSLEAKHQGMMDELSGTSEEEFDQLYLSQQLTAHEEAVALFSSYAQEGEEGPVKATAQELLPILEEHLQEVQSLVE